MNCTVWYYTELHLIIENPTRQFDATMSCHDLVRVISDRLTDQGSFQMSGVKQLTNSYEGAVDEGCRNDNLGAIKSVIKR